MKTFRSSLLSLLGLSLISVPAFAGHHEEGGMQHGEMMHPEHHALHSALMSDIRADDRARDKYRNPAETLMFFGITPDMKVGEYGPGGGWYTRVLLPYVAEAGEYVAINADVERYMDGSDADRLAAAKQFPETFPPRAAEWTGVDAGEIGAFEIDEPPEEELGTFDAVLVFRSLHGLTSREMVDSTLAQTYALLKPGGVVGVVQHRAPDGASYEFSQGDYGYLKQDQIIGIFESEGFELIGMSEVNANPNDPANHEGGVWTLPPTLRFGDENRETYEAIGESDRMTLLFRKPGA